MVVDGDHSAAGVRRDIEDLLDSPAVGRTVIVIHDTANERVRLGVDAVRFAAWPKVEYVHLDWVPDSSSASRGSLHELWYGLGLVVVDAARSGYGDGEVFEQRYFAAAPLLAAGREELPRPRRCRGAGEGMPNELEDLRWELDAGPRAADAAGGAGRGRRLPSWRLTAPLRRAKPGAVAARRHGDERDADRAGLS